MAQIEARLPETKRRTRGRVVVESRVRRPRAPFSLRCGALLVDYTLVVSIVAFATIVARTLDGGAGGWTSEAVLAFGYLAALAVTGLNFLVLPVFVGTTIGKWTAGLRIERYEGDALDFGHATLRHTIGYLASLLTLGGGFLLAVFNAEGRALHDRIAGTVVVRVRGGNSGSGVARSRQR